MCEGGGRERERQRRRKGGVKQKLNRTSIARLLALDTGPSYHTREVAFLSSALLGVRFSCRYN